MDFECWIAMTDIRRAGGMMKVAREMPCTVTGVVVGDRALADVAARAGFDEVLFFETQDGVPAEALAATVAASAKERLPRVVLANDAPASRMILGAIAGALGAAVLGQLVSLAIEGEVLKARCQVAGGIAIGEDVVEGPLAAIFVGEDCELGGSGETEIERQPAEPAAARIEKVSQAGGAALKLADAVRIVGIGRGVRSKDDLSLAEGLAKALGAEIACSLPIAEDAHWLSPERVIGSSHNQVAPELYVALGISGSPNHMSGVRDAKAVVSVNNDPDAGIFRRSDYGIVGDLYKVVPALTEALEGEARER